MMTPRVDLLVELKELIMGYEAATKGMFNAEIERLSKVRDENKMILQQITQGQNLENMKANADAYHLAKVAEADNLMKKAKDFQATLAEKEFQLNAEKKAFEEDEKSFDSKVEEWNREYAKTINDIQARTRELSPKEQELAAQARSLEEREKALKEGQAELKSKLDAMKSIAA